MTAQKQSQNNDEKKIPPGPLKAIAIAWTLPFELVIPIIVGGAIGYGFDRWWHTSPVLMLLLGFLGLIVGIRNVVKAAKLLDKKDAE